MIIELVLGLLARIRAVSVLKLMNNVTGRNNRNGFCTVVLSFIPHSNDDFLFGQLIN